MIAVLAWPTAFEYLLLCGAALLAGMVNAVAGGGTLLTFPSLLWVLGPSAAAAVIANGTSTITVCPGSIASAWGYRRELASMKGWILPLLIPSILGSGLGTWLVARRDPEEFQHLIPWLIFLATVLFLLQPWLARWLKPGKPTEADKLEATATPRLVGDPGLSVPDRSLRGILRCRDRHPDAQHLGLDGNQRHPSHEQFEESVGRYHQWGGGRRFHLVR
jgi:uncharacterized membrane protein YfcA